MTSPVGKVVQQLRQLFEANAASGLRDSELLQRFTATRDEQAFAALVARHGSLVLGVCHRVLQNIPDAEDAFQATFLVLARRAYAVRKPASLASWLYGVAFRLARKMKARAGERRQVEQGTRPRVAAEPDDLSWRELRAVLDDELQRLPERQRQPLLLCFLEGLSQEEAAAQLGWPRGTLKRRLERGRAVLRQRLTRRGLTLAAGLVAAMSAADVLAATVPDPARAAVPKAAALFAARQAIAPDLIPYRTVSLAEGVLKSMLVGKVKFLSIVFVLLGATFGAAALYQQAVSPGNAVADPRHLAPDSQPQSQPESPAREQSSKDNQASSDDTPDSEARSLLAKAIKAHGGQEALEMFPCVRLKMKVVLPGNDPTPKEWEWLFAAPDRLKEVREGYYLGRRRDSVWIADAKGVFGLQDGTRFQPVPAKLAEVFQDDAHLLHVVRLVSLMEKQYEISRTEDSKVDGKPALGLRVRTKGQKDITLFFDAETGLLVKLQRKVRDPGTLEEAAEERFYRDYRKQDGLQFAGKISVTHDGKKDLEIEVKEAKFIQKVNETEFRRE